MVNSYLYRFTFTWMNSKSSFWSPDISEIKKALLNFSVPEGRTIYALEELEKSSVGEKVKINFQQDAVIILDKVVDYFE